MENMNIHEVLKYLPHRYPFLMIDRIVEFESGVRLRALKNVSVNEPVFQGHFPAKPIFPGVLVLEAMAQTTSLLSFCSRDTYRAADELYLLAGVDNARFKRQVEPGDQLHIEARIVRGRRGIWRYQCQACVGDELVCSADITGALKRDAA